MLSVRSIQLTRRVCSYKIQSIHGHSLSARRVFSTSSSADATIASRAKSLLPSFRGRWAVIARTIKYIRIPFLVVSVYGLGYQQGIVDYARDPSAKQEALFDSVIAGVGCTSRDQVDVMTKSSSRLTFAHHMQQNHEMTRRVAKVGSRIVRMAQLLAKKELETAIEAVKAKLPPDCTQEQLQELCQVHPDVIQWEKAVLRLEGTHLKEDDDGWAYVLIDTPVANAFVTEIIPKHIFITTSMMNTFIENDDELALVLGHEVSHLILGHVSEANMIQTFLRTIEVLLLSLDPTEGLLSIAIVAALATTRTALAAAHSRENEHLADDMGVKIAAMACYDTQRAAHVFFKMHQHHTEPNTEAPSAPSILSFLDTHPPSVERHELLVLASNEENVSKYEDSTCASIGARIKGLMASTTKSD